MQVNLKSLNVPEPTLEGYKTVLVMLDEKSSERNMKGAEHGKLKNIVERIKH